MVTGVNLNPLVVVGCAKILFCFKGEQKSALKGFKLEDIRRYGDTILHFFKRLPY